MLGATTDRSRPSRWSGGRLREFGDKAKGLDGDQLAKAAQLLNLEGPAESPDIPQFLASPEAAEALNRVAALRCSVARCFADDGR